MAADAITDTVADMAALLGWMVHHDRPARTAKGWRTAVKGHEGFPDLVLVHPQHGVIFAECKGRHDILEVEQELWRGAITAAISGGACRIRYFVWRPSDLDDGTIEGVLRGRGSMSSEDVRERECTHDEPCEVGCIGED